MVVAYGLILPPEALALPRLGCVNIHGSLLPRWRGAAPIQRALLAGDSETGVTIMQLDAGLDTGPMLLERRHPIGMHDTAGDLHDVVVGARRGRADRSARRTRGGHADRARAARGGVTYAPKIDKAEARLDWSASAVALDRKSARSIHGRWPKHCSQASRSNCCARRWRIRAGDMAPGHGARRRR